MARRRVGRRCTAVLAAAALGAACTATSRPPSGSPQEGRTASCRQTTPYPPPPPRRPHYSIRMRVMPTRDLVTGKLRVTFTPDRPTRRLVFRLWPNGPRQAAEGARLDAGPVTGAGGRPLPGGLVNPTTLVVTPPGGLTAGRVIRVSLPWRLTLAGPVLDRISRHHDAVTLGSFFPILSWVPGRGWARDPATSALGETSTSPTADFDVEVSAPRGLRVLATGAEIGRGRWRALAVRDFALAVGRFRVASARIHAPEPVTVTVGAERGVVPGPRPFLDAARASLRLLARRFGPYPWPTYTIAVMPGLDGAGIEYPTMVFQGAGSLDRATTHEAAHSWFYSLVGNDQARDPWLDEALASWAQARVDGIMGFFRRVPLGATRGRLGEPMAYWQDHPDGYYAGVYAQGVDALRALGPARLVDCALRRYVAHEAYGVATPDDLVSELRRVFPRARATLERFLAPAP